MATNTSNLNDNEPKSTIFGPPQFFLIICYYTYRSVQNLHIFNFNKPFYICWNIADTILSIYNPIHLLLSAAAPTESYCCMQCAYSHTTVTSNLMLLYLPQYQRANFGIQGKGMEFGAQLLVCRPMWYIFHCRGAEDCGSVNGQVWCQELELITKSAVSFPALPVSVLTHPWIAPDGCFISVWMCVKG